jgi:hypothetical protein
MPVNIKKELSGIALDDERRNKRALELAASMARAPGESLRSACGGWSEAIGGFRLLHSPAVTPEKIFAPHQAATLQRAAHCNHLLFVDDTTELDFTGHKALKGAGRLDHDHRRGFYAHNHLLVDEDSGVALGVCGSKLWTRQMEGKGHQHKQVAFEEKESYRWFEGYRQASCLARSLPGAEVLFVGDRESDIYEIYAEHMQCPAEGKDAAGFVIRAGRDRALQQKAEHLYASVRAATELGTYQVEFSNKQQLRKLGAKQGGSKRSVFRKGRKATLQVRATEVTLRPPYRKHGDPLPAVTLRAVGVFEQDPPEGQQPIEWLLLTSLPVENLTQAMRVIHAYAKRWLIEELHRILKSGCRVEQIQLRNSEALLPAVALYLIVAWRILYLRDFSRTAPQLPCTAFFSEQEWRAALIINQRSPTAQSPPNLGELVGMIGKMGGHMGRKKDPSPGPECLWRGMEKLRHYVEMGQILGAF